MVAQHLVVVLCHSLLLLLWMILLSGCYGEIVVDSSKLLVFVVNWCFWPLNWLLVWCFKLGLPRYDYKWCGASGGLVYCVPLAVLCKVGGCVPLAVMCKVGGGCVRNIG